VKTITLGLYGGLGNQMFQYAFARKLSLEKNALLVLDLYGFDFDSYYQRGFDLKNFNIKYDGISAKNLLKFHLSRFIYKFPCNIWSKLFRSLIVERRRLCDFSDVKIKCNPYVFGYWQNENYFREIREIIKEDFKLLSPISAVNTELIEEISLNSNSVSVHVRRMHGLSASSSSNSSQSSKNGSLLIKYYEEAVALILNKVPHAKFYIFSDNPAWAKSNLQFIPNATYLENDRGEDFEDIILMSNCFHHVVANSSFSWWGAWLAEKPAQIVIAPPKVAYSPDIPSNWITLS